MFGRKIPLFRIFGFQVGIDFSWFLLVIVITWTLAEGVFAQRTPELSAQMRWIMGAAGALELAGNLPSFDDQVVHPTINITALDPECAIPNLVINEPKRVQRVDTILNNSFGMLGINSALIVKRFVD